MRVQGIRLAALEIKGPAVDRKGRRIVVFVEDEGAVPVALGVFEVPDLRVLAAEPGGVGRVVKFRSVIGEGDPVKGESILLRQEF